MLSRPHSKTKPRRSGCCRAVALSVGPLFGFSFSFLFGPLFGALFGSLFANAAGAAEAAEQQAARLPLNELRTFADVFNHIRLGYVEEVDDSTLLKYAIQGMLSGLDPHSVYLTAADFEHLQTTTDGEFTGLGLEVGMENGFVKIISPIDDTPASRAGLASGDTILKLDQHPLKGMTLNEAVDLMRGPSGSSIEMTIARESVSRPFTLTLVRAVIRIASVRHRWLAPGYAYLRIAQFQRRTGADTGAALQQLMAQQTLAGLVLDLRNNPGGVLRASVEVASHFLDGGTVVYTEGRLDDSQAHYDASPGDASAGVPIVVLINSGSASAAEIVAGALQDRHRAVVMGTPSFGKGSVQTVVPLPQQRAIKLTTALYFTPSGRSIQAQGIEPDIEVERARLTAFNNVPGVMEADLAGRLDNGNSDNNSDSRDNGDSADAGTGSDADNAPDLLDPQAPGDELSARDNQLYEALNLLKGVHLLGLYRAAADSSGGGTGVADKSGPDR